MDGYMNTEQMTMQLLGDSRDYLKMLVDCQKQTTATVEKVVKDVTGIETAFNGAANFANRLIGQMQGLIGITSLLGAAIKSIQLRAEMEQLEVSFKVLTGSTDMAMKTLKDLSKFAAETPFQMPEVVNAAKQMLAFGQRAEDIVPTMKMLGDVSSALNIPLGSLTYLFGTLKAQGRAMTVDINQFAMRGIPIWKELEKQLNKTNAEVRLMVEHGEIGFNQIERAFQNMTKTGGQFGDMMKQQSETLAGLYSTLQDNVNFALRDLGDTIVKAGGLKDWLKSAIETAGNFGDFLKDLNPTIKTLVFNAIALAAGIGTLNLGFKALMWIGPWVTGLTFGPLAALGRWAVSLPNLFDLVGMSLVRVTSAFRGLSLEVGSFAALGSKIVNSTLFSWSVGLAALAAGAYLAKTAVGYFTGGTRPSVEQIQEYNAEEMQKKTVRANTRSNLALQGVDKEVAGLANKPGIDAQEEYAKSKIKSMDELQGKLEQRLATEQQWLKEAKGTWYENSEAIGGYERQVMKTTKEIETVKEATNKWKDALDKVDVRRLADFKDAQASLKGLHEEMRNIGKSKQQIEEQKLFGADVRMQKKNEATGKFEDVDKAPLLLQYRELQVAMAAKKATESAKTLRDHMGMTLATMGMTGKEEEIFKLKMEGANEVVLAQVRALDLLTKAAEQHKKAKEAINNLRFEGWKELQEGQNIARYLKGDFGPGMTSGQLARQAQRKQLVADKTSPIDLAKFDEADRVKTAVEKWKDALVEGKKITEEFLTPQEKFVKQQKELDRLFQAGALGEGAKGVELYGKAMAKAKEETMGMLYQTQRIEGLKAGSVEARDFLQDNYMKLRLNATAVPGVAVNAPPQVGLTGLEEKENKMDKPLIDLTKQLIILNDKLTASGAWKMLGLGGGR